MVEKHYEGVFPAKRKDGTVYYRSSLTHRRKHISLGSFTDAKNAHHAYLEGRRILEDTSLTLKDYSDTSPLSFSKWVCIMNFRDNGLYLGNPIYVRQRFFYYYLSSAHILKFDMDDLFYYGSHKIMCRGNHYFVADYGMQVNIVNRYGIRNYAVPGVDYRFRNGDPTDFRRENIEIYNIYNGVRSITKNGRHLYAARIHVNGNYLIGVYESELEAAIAYNKAIDLLRKNGWEKNYSPNYVDTLSPSKYAEIYAGLKISPKLSSIFPNNL